MNRKLNSSSKERAVPQGFKVTEARPRGHSCGLTPWQEVQGPQAEEPSKSLPSLSFIYSAALSFKGFHNLLRLCLPDLTPQTTLLILRSPYLFRPWCLCASLPWAGSPLCPHLAESQISLSCPAQTIATKVSLTFWAHVDLSLPGVLELLESKHTISNIIIYCIVWFTILFHQF